MAERQVTLRQSDLDSILHRIVNGESQVEIAQAYGTSPANLSMWLAADQTRYERSAQARAASAEAWLDKGLAVVEKALYRDAGMDSNAARAYEQACARRAAIRNPQYRDRSEVTHVKRSVSTMSTAELEHLARQKALTLQADGTYTPGGVVVSGPGGGVE